MENMEIVTLLAKSSVRHRLPAGRHSCLTDTWTQQVRNWFAGNLFFVTVHSSAANRPLPRAFSNGFSQKCG